MELEQVKGNTWVLKSWELIPFYKLDDSHCILLDTGLNDQREDLEGSLREAGLTPVGVICSHAHIDHMGNVAYLKQTYGTQLAMSLGEAGHQMSYLGLNITNYLMSPEDVVESPPLHGTPCLADRIILPTEDRITFCGATFDIIHTPGHTVDHICTRTPDNVLYLGDAMMTGRTLHHSKFPFAFCVRDYLDSMRKMRPSRRTNSSWPITASMMRFSLCGYGGPVLCRADGGPAGPGGWPHHPGQDGCGHLPDLSH